MEIKGKIYCFFEQSGTFKREFIKLGYQAEDFDIQDNFGETDHQIDLFHEIEEAYRGGRSVFDQITKNDLIMAFFPCIYFSCMSQMLMSWTHRNYKNMSAKEKTDAILERSDNRERFFSLVVKLHSVCLQRGLRLVMENPWSEQTFLKNNFLYQPSLVDYDRTRRGDYMVKPTAYWFVNCKHEEGMTYQKAKKGKNICQMKKNDVAGMCSEERSMISPDYARNFICDCILGMAQPHIDLQLF